MEKNKLSVILMVRRLDIAKDCAVEQTNRLQWKELTGWQCMKIKFNDTLDL